MANPDATVFTAAQRVRSFEDIIAQVRDAVAEGRLRPGERLPSERALAESFGVSRATLREALRSLEALGVVEIRLGATGGAFASEPDERLLGNALGTLMAFRGATAKDLAEFRIAFESDNARWAVRQATDEDRAAFDELVKEAAAASAAEQPDWRVIGGIDMRWHEAVARATHNPIRIGIMLGIHTAMRRAFATLADPLMRHRAEVHKDMERFARAVQTGESEEAAAIMQRHVELWNERTLPLAER
ncbi:MAG TPA: GntR family transcriptional regulator [Solirubrobacteraceae bacterium]|jgi:GntR family transcriptional repressor for pyruvate dehydrogenase complex|nr:GntR family transcriptional regulator [Solirubrobacteraceae bacterium]